MPYDYCCRDQLILVCSLKLDHGTLHTLEVTQRRTKNLIESALLQQDELSTRGTASE